MLGWTLILDKGQISVNLRLATSLNATHKEGNNGKMSLRSLTKKLLDVRRGQSQEPREARGYDVME